MHGRKVDLYENIMHHASLWLAHGGDPPHRPACFHSAASVDSQSSHRWMCLALRALQRVAVRRTCGQSRCAVAVRKVVGLVRLGPGRLQNRTRNRVVREHANMTNQWCAPRNLDLLRIRGLPFWICLSWGYMDLVMYRVRYATACHL
jgi:hypothetical protein